MPKSVTFITERFGCWVFAHEDVTRLDIPVNNALLMRVIERGGNVTDDFEALPVVSGVSRLISL